MVQYPDTVWRVGISIVLDKMKIKTTFFSESYCIGWLPKVQPVVDCKTQTKEIRESGKPGSVPEIVRIACSLSQF